MARIKLALNFRETQLRRKFVEIVSILNVKKTLNRNEFPLSIHIIYLTITCNNQYNIQSYSTTLTKQPREYILQVKNKILQTISTDLHDND